VAVSNLTEDEFFTADKGHAKAASELGAEVEWLGG